MAEDFDAEKAITRVSDSINQPDKMGELLKITLEKSKTAEQAIQAIIIALLSTNVEVREAVNRIIAKYAEDDWSTTRNKAIRYSIIFVGFIISNGIAFYLGKH